MTANVRLAEAADGKNAWTNRRELVVKTFLTHYPDILGCQEVTPAQGAYLHKELAKWYSYFPRPGVGKQDEESAGKSLIGSLTQSVASLNTIYYRTDRFDILDGEAGLVIPGSLQRDASENTFYTLAILKEKAANGKTFIVVDTHLRHNPDFAVKCALALREKIAAQLKTYPDSPVILLGDINHDAKSKPYAALTGTNNAADGAGTLTDTFDYSKKRPNENWGSWHNFTGTSNRTLPTDLIFTKNLTPQETKILQDSAPNNQYPSDHFFTLSTLKTAKQNP
jgi:endonuclease/exonuclease/phosphatase family metal-dependent hydrolase